MLLNADEIKQVLRRTLPNHTETDIDKAVKAITETTGKWQEVDLKEKLGAGISIQCRDICAVGEAYSNGCRIRAFMTPA